MMSPSPTPLNCPGWAIPAGDLMTIFGCGLQEKGLEITLGDLGLPLGYSDVPLEGTADLPPALLEEQNVSPAPSRLLQ